MECGKLLYGLIGFPLYHSFSAAWFTEKFRQEGKINHQYRLFPLGSVEEFLSLIRSETNLAGVNVTI
ncbi:MAG: shikimate dehydrogenase, partial [Bacteroidetes bacterium]|nr:shikimate dehydrogenase [Bacteroidota bacterium]